MTRRIEHEEEAIGGSKPVEEYAEATSRHAKLQYRALLKDLKGLDVSGRYLEMGAGPGVLAVMLAEDNPRVEIVAADLSPEMVAAAQAYVEGRGLEDRVRCVAADAADGGLMEALGRFDLVYSAFSLHHWKDPVKSVEVLWSAVKDGGVLYIHDLKRVWWLYYLPVDGGDIQAIRAAYVPGEIRAILQRAGIDSYEIKTPFPFFWQSIVARKSEPTAVGGVTEGRT